VGQPIANVTIVGGGTAGWITAAYLNHRLQWGLTARSGVRIVVIESPSIPSVGVGEATVPTLKGTLRMLEISEAEFVARTDASLKLGIRFDRWQLGSDGHPVSFFHPFTGGGAVRGRNPGYAFLEYGLDGSVDVPASEFVSLISHSPEAIAQGKGPRNLGGEPFAGPLQYAYHLDAALMADFFREICIERGVEHVLDDVEHVDVDGRGHVSALHLARHGHWPIELVIDCTGFKGLLINEALGEPFQSYSEYLINDRALPLQAKRLDPDFLTPATVSTAMDAGWAWRTPLYSRDGNGYVYSSAFASDDQAHEEMLTHLKGAELLTEPRVTKMRVGRNRRSWVGNCVAIGLSGGFLEPLESTGIMSIELAVRWLLQYFPTTDFETSLQRQFNTLVQGFYEEVRDFLSLHFTLGNRADTPYWRAARHELKRSDALEANLDLWRHRLPSASDERKRTVFNEWSLQCLLMAKGFYAGKKLPSTELVPPNVWRYYAADRKAARKGTVETLADHIALLESIRQRAAAGERRATIPKGRGFEIPEDHLLLFATQIMSRPVPSRRHAARRVEFENR
jgi:hypothetical protein